MAVLSLALVSSFVCHSGVRWCTICVGWRSRWSRWESGIPTRQAVMHRPGSGRWAQRERWGRKMLIAEGGGDERSLAGGVLAILMAAILTQ